MKTRLLLSFIALVGLVSGAWAQIESFGLKVAGVEVTTENMTDVLGDGSVRFDGGKTLTLVNASITIDENIACGPSATTVTVSGGIHLLSEGGERATEEEPLTGGGLAGASDRFGRYATTLEVSGANTMLQAKGNGVATTGRRRLPMRAMWAARSTRTTSASIRAM